jgi:methylphosphotriester-DNA--protein-cysteine methyltransferase
MNDEGKSETRNPKSEGNGKTENGKHHCEHAKWRRITGITEAVEGQLSRKERRKGLGRLVKWLEKSETRNPKFEGNGETENGETERNHRGTESDGVSGLGVRDSGNSAAAADENGDKSPQSKNCELPSLTKEWGTEVEEWAGSRGNSVERMCVELEISRARLTMLTKEYCGLTVAELVDGWKVRELRRRMYERLKEAADALWGVPGSFVEERVSGFGDRGSGDDAPLPLPPPARGGGKRSRYRMTAEEYASESRGEERVRRIGELVARMREGFDLEEWAAEAGFGSGAKLKRAVLNVMGRTLKSVERMLAAEVVRYYICAEEKALREIACRAESAPSPYPLPRGERGKVARARWLYHKSEDAPVEPFLDEWSKAEAFTKEWLEWMKGALGRT